MLSFGLAVVGLRVISGFVVVVVGQLVPAESRFSNLVPGQQPKSASQLISVVAAVLAGASVAVVETGQFLPVASRFLMLVPGQHP